MIRGSDIVCNAADNFVKWAINKLKGPDKYDLEVQKSLPVMRLQKRKIMTGKTTRNEVISYAITGYRIQVHNVIFDVITDSMNHHFLTSKTLYADFTYVY
jgi:hypothetical protein